jgi:hypothetical protein
VARGEFKEAVLYDPKLVLAHYDLGRAELEIHHDKAAAMAEYKILKPLDPRVADRLREEISK